MRPFTESIVEEAALNWFGEMGYSVKHAGSTLTPALSQRERESYADVVLVGRLRANM